jgi:hypothetical protein
MRHYFFIQGQVVVFTAWPDAAGFPHFTYFYSPDDSKAAQWGYTRHDTSWRTAVLEEVPPAFRTQLLLLGVT